VVFKKKMKNRSYVSVDPIVDVAVAEAPVAEEKPVKKAEPKVEIKEEAPKAEVKKEAPKTETKADDLTKLDGVGPKLAEILTEGGFTTFAAVATASVEDLQKVLEAAGNRYASKDPAPWIEQAKGLA